MTSTVERRSKLSYNEFVTSYLEPRRPVVITDAARHWKALKWSPEYFRKVFGERKVTTYESRVAASSKGEDGLMRDSIDAILSSSSDEPARYVSTFPLHKIPELLDDVSPVHEYLVDNWLESPLLPHFAIDLFLGGPGATLRAIHHERIHHHGFTTLTYGKKLFMFWSPEQAPYMYLLPGLGRHKSAIADPLHPDLETYPLFAKAEMVTCELNPGETLFIPAGWWHTSKVLSTSINIHHCFMNHTNWHDMVTALKERIALEGRWGAFKPFTQAPNCCTPVPAAAFLAQLLAVGRLKGASSRSRREATAARY